MSSLLERLRADLAPKYEVERELGRGGMGSVFLARDTVLDRPVAIKVLRPETAAPGSTARLQDEARILARLRHPGLVSVHTAGFAADAFYYVMDYVEGDTLGDRLRAGPLEADEALELGAQLLEALAAAHERGIVHRDVTPGNVFLAGGRALLADFGIGGRDEGATPEAPSTPARPGTWRPSSSPVVRSRRRRTCTRRACSSIWP